MSIIPKQSGKKKIIMLREKKDELEDLGFLNDKIYMKKDTFLSTFGTCLVGINTSPLSTNHIEAIVDLHMQNGLSFYSVMRMMVRAMK